MTERKYTGILADRIDLPLLLWADNDSIQQYDIQMKARISALFEEFDVDISEPDLWRSLAIKMAERHVPAFGSKEPGRPVKNQDENLRWFLHFLHATVIKQFTHASAFIEVAQRYGVEANIVKERIKRLRQKADFKNFETCIDRAYNSVGTKKYIEILFSEIEKSDPEFDKWYQQRESEIKKKPFKDFPQQK